MAFTAMNDLRPDYQKLDRPGIQPDVGMKPPSWAGDVVAVTVSKDTVYIACQRGVSRLCSHGLRPIAFLEAAERSSRFPPAPLEKIDA